MSDDQAEGREAGGILPAWPLLAHGWSLLANSAQHGPTGSAPRLSDRQLAAVDQALRKGARTHGFDTDHWTLARITGVIEQLTGVSYHRGHVWKLLRHRLHYRLQRPARRAVERDERAIARWVAEDWP